MGVVGDGVVYFVVEVEVVVVVVLIVDTQLDGFVAVEWVRWIGVGELVEDV